MSDQTLSRQEALQHLEWRDHGTAGGIKSYVLHFRDEDGRPMRYGEVSRENRRGAPYCVDGSNLCSPSLRIARQEAVRIALDRLTCDGYITRESQAPDECQMDDQAFGMLVAIAADSIQTLRKMDVERVLRAAPSNAIADVARRIISARPELEDEVWEVLQEMGVAGCLK